MKTLDKIKNVIKDSQKYESIQVITKSSNSVISTSIADSVKLIENDSILKFELNLAGYEIMVVGFNVNLIEDVKALTENNLFVIEIYVK